MARHHGVSEPTVSRILAPHRAGLRTVAAEGELLPASDHPSDSERVAGVLPAAVLEERMAIVGTSGSGKTYAAKALVERLMDGGARVCIVDPLGVWWGLRLGADGLAPAPGPVVVFGGRHADIALAPGQGAALGHLFASQALACVVDVSDLGSAAVRRAFVTAFTGALHEANAEPLALSGWWLRQCRWLAADQSLTRRTQRRQPRARCGRRRRVRHGVRWRSGGRDGAGSGCGCGCGRTGSAGRGAPT